MNYYLPKESLLLIRDTVQSTPFVRMGWKSNINSKEIKSNFTSYGKFCNVVCNEKSRNTSPQEVQRRFWLFWKRKKNSCYGNLKIVSQFQIVSFPNLFLIAIIVSENIDLKCLYRILKMACTIKIYLYILCSMYLCIKIYAVLHNTHTHRRTYIFLQAFTYMYV